MITKKVATVFEKEWEKWKWKRLDEGRKEIYNYNNFKILIMKAS